MPWETEVGFAYQLGPRPLNPTWENPHEQEAPVRRRIDEARARRAAVYEVEIAKVPPADQPARRAELEREEAAVQDLENERADAEAQRLYYARRARYANWPRERILLLASVLFTGPSEGAVSVAGFLDQRGELVGHTTSITPRLGLEGEPIRDRMRARVGTYVEPSRYPDGFPRQHFTFGADLKLFPFNAWGLLAETTWLLGAYIDVAPRYTNAGIGIGAWH
jgi:hypothetical protein